MRRFDQPKTRGISFGLLLVLSSTNVSAATFSVNDIAGIWQNSLMESGGSASGEGTESMRWGNPVGSTGKSGYDFGAATTPLNVEANELFVLGTFNHLNFPVTGDFLDSADLEVSISGSVETVDFGFNSVFQFDHFETPNGASPCAVESTVQPCPDLVTLLNPQDLTQTVMVGDLEYTLEISGFVLDAGDPSSFLTHFVTLEGENNQAYLVGRFSEPLPITPVPLPASAWLLLAAFGLIGGSRQIFKSS